MVTLAVVGGLVLAACGDDDEPETSAPTSADTTEQLDGATTTAPADLTESPISLMVTGTITSTIGTFEQNVAGAEAAAAAINAEGGVEGHPIEIVTCNDERAAARAAQCAQEAVDGDVAAVVGSVFLATDYYPILEAGGVPFVGGPAGFPQEAASPLSYPLVGGSTGEYEAMGSWLAGNAGTNVAVLQGDNPQAIFIGQSAGASAEAAGATIVSEVSAPVGAPDFSPFAANILESDPEVVILALLPIDVVPAVQALRAQGYEGDLGVVLFTFGPDIVETLGDAAEGVYTFTSWSIPDVTESPLMDRYNAEMDEHAPDAIRDAYSEGAWAAVNVVAQALEGSESVDRAALVDGLDGLEVDLVGMAGGGPFSLSPDSGVSEERPRIFNPFVTVYQVEDGEYVLVEDFFDPIEDPTGSAS